MDFEFQGADGVRNSLDVITQAMSEIVHRINTPLIAGMMMLRVANAVKHRIAQPDVWRSHVDLRFQSPSGIRKLAFLHAREEIKVLIQRPIPERAFASGPVGSAAIGISVCW